jgi:hypothetical protein
MKFAIIALLTAAFVVNGLAGYRLFRASSYDLSDVMIIASYLSLVFIIYVMTTRRNRASDRGQVIG